MIGVTVVSGINLALKKPTTSLEGYPELAGHTITFVVTFTTVTGVLALIFKFPAVVLMGPWLERKLRGEVRKVRLRDVFHAGIRRAVFWGGSLQALYQMGVIGLVAYVSPSGISAARACVIVPLAFLEWHTRMLKPSGARWWLRLIASMTFTISGAFIVIFEGGFKLVKEGGLWPIVLLIALTMVGNFLLAYAEIHEYWGVHDLKAAAPVYSLARVMMHAAACCVGLLIVGLLWQRWDVMWGTVVLCWDRWWLVLPVALFGAITDTSRICVKALITATYMYMMLGMSTVVDILLQIPLKRFFPDIYDNVHPGWHTVFVAAMGATLLMTGIRLYPFARDDDPKAPQPAAPVGGPIPVFRS